MKKSICLIAAVILLAVTMIGSACGDDKETPTPTATITATPTPTATPAHTPKPDADKTITIGAVPATSSTSVFFSTMGQILNDAIPEIDFVVKDTLGSQAVMFGLIDKSYDLGQSLSSVEVMAYLGITPWDTPNTDLRRLFSWYTQILTITVTEASGIQSLADLNGKKLRIGPSGTYTESNTKLILGALDIVPEYDTKSLDSLEADLIAGTIDGFVKYVRPDVADETITAAQVTTPVKLLTFSAEDIQKVTDKYTYMTFGKIEDGVYENVGEIDSFTIVATVATFKDSLSEGEAYLIVKAVWEGKDTLSAAYPEFEGYQLPEETIATTLAPLHAGAYKYFEELGLTIMESIIPPEANQ